MVFRDRIFVPVRLGVRLGNHLMDTPGMGIELEHFFVALFGYEQMGAPPVIKNVHVFRSKFGSSVERRNGLFWVFGGELDNTKPHPGIGIGRIKGSLPLQRGNGLIDMI